MFDSDNGILLTTCRRSEVVEVEEALKKVDYDVDDRAST